MESTVIPVSVVHHSQVNTVRWNKFPVPLIHVRGVECVVHQQITRLTPVDVQLVGKVHAAVRM